MNLTGAEITIKLLEQQGIDTIIGIPGGSNLPIYDALYESSIRHILARHEQGAAFIAQGIARATGKAAVCFATSGPGATNLLTAIADAKLDSVPLIAITGQVPYGAIGTDAFQEVDTYGLTVPITKHNFLVRSLEELILAIPEAFKIAESGRPGPVVIDIPKNIQNDIIDESQFYNLLKETDSWCDTELKINDNDIEKLAAMINDSRKPMLYIGGGVISGDAAKEVRELSHKGSIPVVSTLMALGVLPKENPLYLGMLGMHGTRYTNYLMDESDLIITIGARFDDRAIGNADKFCRKANIAHIDIDDAEINKIKESNFYINGDVKEVLTRLIPLIKGNTRDYWLDRIDAVKSKYPFTMPKKEDKFHPVNIIKYISEIVPKDSIVATDVGQHQMWVAQAYPFTYPRNLLTSGGLGTMGFGLPAAIGAALAYPERQVVCFSGDGSILMNIQELATLADLELNIKVIIMNNGHLGMVRQQQEMFFKEHYIAVKFPKNPDFAAIAKGFGIDSVDLTDKVKPEEVLKKALEKSGPMLINIPIKADLNVYPTVQGGAANTDMIGGGYDGE
ncbi:biosynthetic-type acetolactate synthase large subunit [Clostridium oryzae]|uniref:Acetolactate synthase n=1 Tax=Clostridium oryzae TaxID=1450648 RepID=A0A1V4IN48_9CLOT|nr:biosynthetic-type acetolactate synthase large subunit [Clostridium oryzae]OPJ61326.1 acetolactate synthase isozyme 1 large subunit [Clostridium oryzae]